MPRLGPLDYTALTPEQEWAVQRFKDGQIGAVRGPAEAWLRSPGIADPCRQLVEFVRYSTSLPREVIELALILTGRHWRSQVEFWGHSRMARQAGIPDHVIEAVRLGQPATLDRPDLQACHDLVTEYFATNRVSPETYVRAIEHFGEQGLVELIGAVGLYGLVSMTLNVFDVPLPEGATPPFEEPPTANG